MNCKTYGYVRVSTQVQNEARQLAAMREFGIDEENIVIEKLSGRDFNRPQYHALVGGLCPGPSRASTAWGGITHRFWNNGPLSPRGGKPPLWCWTCPCWIPGRGGTSPEP